MMVPYFDTKREASKRDKETYIHAFVEKTQHFDKCVVINCFPTTPRREEDELDEWKAFLATHSDDQTLVIFENVYEGNVSSSLRKIYRRIPALGISRKNVIFASGAYNVAELHGRYCSEHGVTDPLEVTYVNAWERAMQENCATTPEPVPYTAGPQHNLFLSFNRISRPHRIGLVGMLYHHDLLSEGYCSFFQGSYGNTTFRECLGHLKKLVSASTFNTINHQILKHIPDFPLKLNTVSVNDNINYHQTDDEKYYRDSLLSVVTETFFFKTVSDIYDDEGIFFSEKTFKPILAKHPFILMNRPRSLKALRSLGYRTFAGWIDESYDLIEDDEQRFLAIISELVRFNAWKNTWDQDMWDKWNHEMYQITEHNYRVLSQQYTPTKTVEQEFYDTISPEMAKKLTSMYASEPQSGYPHRSALAQPFQIDGSTRISMESGLDLFHLCMKVRPKNTLELGLAYGFSTLYILEAQKHHPFTHTAVDPGQFYSYGGVGFYNGLNFSSHGRFYLEEMNSFDALMYMKNRKFELIFIDAGHRFDDVLVDFTLAAPLCTLGGYIVLDDLCLPSITKVKDFLVANRKDFRFEQHRSSNLGIFRKISETDNRRWDHFVHF